MIRLEGTTTGMIEMTSGAAGLSLDVTARFRADLHLLESVLRQNQLRESTALAATTAVISMEMGRVAELAIR
jgi:hypothetical protein